MADNSEKQDKVTSSPKGKSPAAEEEAASAAEASAPQTPAPAAATNTDDAAASPEPVAAHPPLTSIEAEDSGTSTDEYDSVYDSDTASLTSTLRSQDKAWKYENNRRYVELTPGAWICPNDDIQQEQMNIFHLVYTRTMGGKLHFAPIGPKPQKVLDAGTGTGVWAIEFAEQYPSAAVIGFDTSAIQPEWVPSNCTFEVDDFEKSWARSPDSFDFVHARALHGAVSDWTAFCKEAYKVLKPGGWIEICGEVTEFHSDDGTLPENSHIQEWMKNVHKATEQLGKTLNVHKVAKEALLEAGFDESTYVQKIYKMPVGTWPKDKAVKKTGEINLVNLLMGIEGFVLALYTRALGMSEEDARNHVEKCMAELKNKKIHSYFPFQITYAQKPLSAA